jgi:hypothetical protein
MIKERLAIDMDQPFLINKGCLFIYNKHHLYCYNNTRFDNF